LLSFDKNCFCFFIFKNIFEQKNVFAPSGRPFLSRSTVLKRFVGISVFCSHYLSKRQYFRRGKKKERKKNWQAMSQSSISRK